jgi:Calcineurin-like phosphoesterase
MACDQQAQGDRASSKDGISSLKILHLSDLHLGWRFEKSNWRQLLGAAKDAKPDLVLVTGDLVNTPWFWMLKKARKALDQLSTELAHTDGSKCTVWVVPGNHDTRVMGIFPIRWLLPASLIAAIVGAIVWWLVEALGTTPPWFKWLLWSIAGATWITAITCALLRALTRRSLEKILGDAYLLTKARLTSNARVGVVPIDSATYGVSWARGSVPSSQFADFHEQMKEVDKQVASGGSPPTWIAMVHHHVLPLPYDSSREHMMVMDNAGALLAELWKCGVRLILHGHKHHQHFARIIVDSARAPRAEMAVLSAGTPTEAKNAGYFWHGFNVVTVDPDGRTTIEMYEAPPEGGAFEKKPPFDLVPIETQEYLRFERDAKHYGLECRRLICQAEISNYGDARFFREYKGVSTTKQSVQRIPGVLVAEATCGLMEAYVARCLSNGGPSIVAKTVSKNQALASRIEVELRFEGDGLQCDEEPIDFFTEVYGNNAFALNRWQFDAMYPGRSDYTEDAKFPVPKDMATGELVIQVRFPSDVGIPKRIGIKANVSGIADGPWIRLPPTSLLRLNLQNTVQLRVPYPVPGATYQINWDLKENSYGDGNPTRERGIERALGLRSWLGKMMTVSDVPEQLLRHLNAIEVLARTEVGDNPEKALDCALFVFEEETKSLRYLVGTHDKKDDRHGAKYRFGLGLPGRAFKAAAPVGFRRPPSTPGERPWCYVRPNGERVTDSGQVPEVAILAIPLAPPEAPDWPYCVLQFSNDDPSCMLKTADTLEDSSIKGLAEDLCNTVTIMLEKLYNKTN